MDLLLNLEPTSSRRAQLERQLRDGIRSGRLRPGAPLPPSRTLAHQLGVSRGVVVDAYSQLAAEGYLTARRGSGTRVAATARAQYARPRTREERVPPIRHDLRSGVPDVSAFPRHTWQSATARALRELPDAWLLYGRPRGFTGLRVALTDYLARARATVAEPGRILICTGISHGLTVIWRALRERGAQRVGVEDPAWPGQPDSVRHAGLEPVPIRVDDRGLVVSELEDADLDAVVVTPSHQHPTGVIMAPERRAALVEWARRRGSFIVEDDYDAEYRYDRDPVAALQGMAPDHVVYAGTASKMLAPGLRLAWLVLPHALVDDVTAEQDETKATPAVIDQAALGTMIERGELERHLRQMRRRYRSRRDALLDALTEHIPEARVGGAAAGLHLVAWLPETADEATIAARARQRGVAVHTLHGDCAAAAPVLPALLLGYSSIPEQGLHRAVRRLAPAVRSTLHL
jgi:GntR family transcriptional regulator/MocR family aminotransferase